MSPRADHNRTAAFMPSKPYFMNCSAAPGHPLRTAAILVAAAAFLGSHIAAALRQPDGALALAALQAIATGAALSLTLRSRRWFGPLAALALLLALALGARHSPAAGLLAGAGAAHALLYTALLIVFANTLRPGRTALITLVASRLNPGFHAGMIAYTRAVTAAWALFFALQLLASAILLATDPPLWRLFVTTLHLPLVLAMTLAEFAVRRRRWRHQSIGLLETIRGTRRLWALKS